MTTLREAAQQALEACEQRLPLQGQAAIIDELNNLRAALAEPVHEPEALKDPAEYDDFAAAMRHNERITTWRYDSVGPVALETVYETIIHWDEGGGKRSRRELARRIVALYPAPPQRNPLSDADLAKIWDDALDQLDPRDQLRFIARAIERAHGIV